jgi:hypothetical protein
MRVGQIRTGSNLPDDWARPLSPEDMTYVADLLTASQEE